MAIQIKKSTLKKNKKAAPNGVAHIQSTFNNTIVTITNVSGETISWASAGAIGFKGAKKGTPFAAQIAAEKASKEAIVQGVKKAAPNGVAHIQSTFNNTIVTITNVSGETISWASAGAIGFKGAKKGTPFAAQIAAEKASKDAIVQGVKKAEVLVCGPGAGRETAIRALQAAGLEITLIRDITPVPHNGCRPPKKRRI